MALVKQPLRVAIIGTARRSGYLYGPLLKALPDDVQLVSVWGRSEESARRLGEQLEVPWYTHLDRLIRGTAPDMAIVSVSYDANGIVGLMAVEAGLHVLLETPIAHRLSEADAIIAAAGRHGLKIEVAEQFHRRPAEQIVLQLINAGVFGRIYTSFNDFAGHGYHGVSVLRSYLGFNVKPAKVTGAVQRYELAPHWSRLANATGQRIETQEHGIVEFESGQLGFFHWTDVRYDSALRWWRSSRFMGEKGMGIMTSVGLDSHQWLSTLSPDGQVPQFINVERRYERVDGGALIALVAHTQDPDHPTLTWENPLYTRGRVMGRQWHDDEIGVAGCILSLVDAIRFDTQPSYGPYQARLDQEITLAYRLSAQEGGRPIQLPLDPAAQMI